MRSSAERHRIPLERCDQLPKLRNLVRFKPTRCRWVGAPAIVNVNLLRPPLLPRSRRGNGRPRGSIRDRGRSDAVPYSLPTSWLGAPLLRRETRVLPLHPAHVHFLHVESVLRQLQSGLRREVSCRVPAVRDVLLRLVEAPVVLLDLLGRHRDRSRDVLALVRGAVARVDEHEVALPFLHSPRPRTPSASPRPSSPGTTASAASSALRA